MPLESGSIKALQNVFRRLSFGFNGDKTPNSSTAVACGLILNYLDRTVDSHILPPSLKAENLRGTRYDALQYMRTDWLHSYLLRSCRLAPGRFGRWGKSVVHRFAKYWEARPWTIGVVVRCRFGGYGVEKAWRLIKREVDSNRPAMATVRRCALAGGKLKWHTVVVCGYRKTMFGRREMLVHTGIYDDSIQGSRVELVYIPLKHLVCSYRFVVTILPPQLPGKAR
jgi:hypothetical protein